MPDELALSRKTRTLYVQVPFCPERCDYCSIPVSLRTDRAPAYVQALFREMKRLREREDLSSVETLYVGGGTPTILPPALLMELLDGLRKDLPPLKEITVESRPDTVTPDILRLLQPSGVTRLSFGMEAVRPEQMTFLGRTMNPYDSVRLLNSVRKDFPGQISMDFIAGGEGFVEEDFLREARALFSEGLDHLSVYPLTVEEQTPLKARLMRGAIASDTEEKAGICWNAVVRDLSSIGWFRYEVANFALAAHSVCRHNQLVWEGYDYAGIGAGAHQRIRSVRSVNVRSIDSYEKRMSTESSPFEVKEVLGEEERLLEIAYTNARLSHGFPLAWLFPDGRSFEIAEAYLASLLSDDLLDRRSFQEGRVVFTEKGREVLDGLMGEIWSRSRP